MRTGATGQNRRRLAKLLATLAAAAILLAGCTNAQPDARSTGANSPSSSSEAASPAPALPVSNPNDSSGDPIVGVVRRVAPAVVNVTTRTVNRDALFGGSSSGKAVGTGFIIRSDGIVVTNFHVVEGATNIKVTLPPPDDRTFDARVIGGNSNHDLAVLRLDGAKGLPTVPLGDSSKVQLGQRVIALGYALALEGGPTVTSGIISSLARTVEAQDPNGGDNGQGITRTYEDVLQTDAAINPGNSGGPLVDLAGNVVGINTAGAGSAENVGFSISIDAARPDIERAMLHPAAPTAYLGVSTTTVTSGLAVQFDLPVRRGAYVLSLSPAGPASKAGIEEGDVIMTFDGKSVQDSEQLGELILDKEPGDRVQVVVARANGNETVTVTLGVRPLPTRS